MAHPKNERLKKARVARNWTQRRLAEEVGYQVTTIRSWENGVRGISLEAKERLTKVFSMSSEELGLSTDDDVPGSQEGSQHITILSSDGQAQEEGKPQYAEPVDPARKSLIQRVLRVWVQGILESSLYKETLILLNFQEQPDAVVNPWRFEVQESRLRAGQIPTGTPIIEIYEKADGQLLILGEPGAGKTTLLLVLARELLQRAERDTSHCVPVVFNLSSWAKKRLPLEQWIVEELHDKYGIPTKIAQKFLEEEKILLLLDGLDESAHAFLPASIQAINRYLEKYGLLPMVVCSRRSDYMNQTNRLQLQASVLVQPLTPQQIEAFTLNGSEDLENLRSALSSDPVLLELATTPLMLSILAFTASDSVSTGSIEGSLADRRAFIFSQYVKRVLAQRGPSPHYHPEHVKRWLAWLAYQMRRRNQTEFHVERLQPDWLPKKRIRSYYMVVVRLINGLGEFLLFLIYALVSGSSNGRDGSETGIFALLRVSHQGPLLGWMDNQGAGVGGLLELIFILVVLLSGIAMRSVSLIERRDILKALWYGLRKALPMIIAFLVFSGIIVGLGSQSVLQGLSAAVTSGLGGGLVYVSFYTFLFLIESKNLSSEIKAIRGGGIKVRLGDALIILACCWTAFTFVDMLFVGWKMALINGLFQGLSTAMFFVFDDRLANSLGQGLGAEIQPTEKLEWSWEQFRTHLFDDIARGVSVGCFTLILVTFVGAVSSVFVHHDLVSGIMYGAVNGLSIGVILAGVVTFIGWLYHGWSSGLVDDHAFFQPNEGIRRSFRYSVFSALVFGGGMGVFGGCSVGLACALIGRLPGWPALAIGFMIALGFGFSLLFGLIYGGIAVIAHSVLRLYLRFQGVIPLNYVSFLDESVRRILLRRVGGGYMFVHTELRDYFASFYEKDEENGYTNREA